MTERTYTFRLLLSGPTDDETAEMLMASCGDMLLGTQASHLSADFDRSATTLEEAVLSAIRDLETASPHVAVERVEPDDLVTATVIAERTGRTRQSVALLIAGDRGPGSFPEPLSFVDSKTRLWRWSEVADWFMNTGLAESTDPISSRERRFIAAINGALEARLNIRAYRDSGGGNSAAFAVRDIVTGGMGSPGSPDLGVSVSAADGGRDIPLSTGVELLDLAVSLLRDQDTGSNGEHIYPGWMEASVAGLSGTLRLYLAGNRAGAAPFEELVAAGMKCAALTRLRQHAAQSSLFPELPPGRSPNDAGSAECNRRFYGGSIAFSMSGWHRCDQDEVDLRAVLVSGLQAPEDVVQLMTVWLTYTDCDHIVGLSSIKQSDRRPVRYGWDDLLARTCVGETPGPAFSGFAVHREGLMPESGEVLTPSQRLWATTWSFGQTLRLYAEKAHPPKVAAVCAALDGLERMR